MIRLLLKYMRLVNMLHTVMSDCPFAEKLQSAKCLYLCKHLIAVIIQLHEEFAVKHEASNL